MMNKKDQAKRIEQIKKDQELKTTAEKARMEQKALETAREMERRAQEIKEAEERRQLQIKQAKEDAAKLWGPMNAANFAALEYTIQAEEHLLKAIDEAEKMFREALAQYQGINPGPGPNPTMHHTMRLTLLKQYRSQLQTDLRFDNSTYDRLLLLKAERGEIKAD